MSKRCQEEGELRRSKRLQNRKKPDDDGQEDEHARVAPRGLSYCGVQEGANWL